MSSAPRVPRRFKVGSAWVGFQSSLNPIGLMPDRIDLFGLDPESTSHPSSVSTVRFSVLELSQTLLAGEG